MTGPGSAPHSSPVTRGYCTRAVALFAVAANGVGLGLSLRHPLAVQLVDGHAIGDAVMGAACGLVAAILLARLPRHPVGRVFLLVAVFDAVASLSGGVYGYPADPHRFTWALWVSEWSWVPGTFIPFVVVPVVVPDGVRGRVRWLLAAGCAAIVGFTFAQAFATDVQSAPHVTVPNRVHVAGADQLFAVSGVVAVASAAAALVVLAARFVRADPTRRRQLLPLVAAIAVIAVAVSTAGLYGRLGIIVQDASLVLLPFAALVSVLRYRLYDLELVIWRTSVWFLLSAALVGAYVAVVEFSAAALGLRGTASSVLAAAAVAVAFGPARAALQRSLARWLYGDRGDPYAALAHTTQVLAGGADPLGALQTAMRDVAVRLRSPGVRVMRDDVVLAGGGVGSAALTVPLRAANREVGRLELEPRSPGERFSAADERLILDLCAPLTNAVAAVGLAEDLRSSRRRLLLAREEERRRVRGELHDDIGPSLAAVAVQAQTALRRLQRRDVLAATEAITCLQQTTMGAVGDLRRVVDALGPRALDAAGLDGALTEFADQFRSEHLTVSVELDTLPSLPAAVESVVYRVVAEALTNTTRHAAATSVAIHGSIADGVLTVEVTDDGRGASTYDRLGGVGIASMRARVDEIGGTLLVAGGTSGTGTRIALAVPVPVPVATFCRDAPTTTVPA